MNKIHSRYNPKEVEDKWYRFWEEQNLFSAKVNPAKKPFCIVIPPPNVTGILHMGHALNNTLQDILIRYHRMLGEESLWMPGTDHAGIATQNVVEKAIAKEGFKRQDLGREKFLERVWQWKEEYGSTIIRQLRKLGASCDWQRMRFTMDEEYSKAVRQVFVSLWEKGLIYQGDRVINWCPRCQTALSDEESPYHELQGNLYYLRYPLKEQIPACPAGRRNPTTAKAGCRLGGKSEIQNPPPEAGPPSAENLKDYIIVATTRPETMLGDTAVAVNPKDKRYKKFVGQTIILPLVNREIKIIADTMVDMKFGTGAVKVTPAHDPKDYLLGKKHKLEFINVMYPDGRMNENAGNYRDMDRFEAREVIIEDLRQQGLLEKIEPYNLSAGHCYRCHTIIEPYLSRQWFVKMKPLAKPAIEAVKKGRIKFYPQRWTKVYLNWMGDIQDWCISRQIWWGHRIPVYYCRKCQETGKSQTNPKSLPVRQAGLSACDAQAGKIQNPCLSGRQAKQGRGIIVSGMKPEKCPTCGSRDIFQDEDVLDTWFSSWLWPFATFQQGQSPSGTVPEEELKYFYPTSVLVTAPEIIFFWVARMIMAGLEFRKDIPFKDVYIHGTVRDIEGKKMSKSLGNIIDPIEIIGEYGADALRFSIISITSQGQDVYLSKERFEQGRNFANKIWNASRFILMNLDKDKVNVDLCVFFKKENLDIVNRWILSRFYSTLKEVTGMLDTYRFNEAANMLYGFFWHEFCDWYLEIIKPDIRDNHNQVVMYKILEKFLRIMHPFMPFITEEVWYMLDPRTSIMTGAWPYCQENLIDKKVESQMQGVFEIINTIRNMRSELDLPPNAHIDAKICLPNKDKGRFIESLSADIQNLCRIRTLNIEKDYCYSPSQFVALVKDTHIVIPIAGIVDVQRHKRKIEERLLKTQADIKAKEGMLANEAFVNNAPKEVVGKEREKLEELKEMLHKLEGVRDGFK